MAMVLRPSRLRLTQAILFGHPGGGGGGTVLSIAGGNGLTPGPVTTSGTIGLVGLTSDWNAGSKNINSRNSVDWINVKTGYGAKGNAIVVPVGTSGGSMTTGSPTLTMGAGTFSAGDVGKYIMVSAAGPGGYELATTIFSYIASTIVTLNASASGNVANVQVVYGTDDTAAFQAAAAALPMYGTLYIPGGQFILDTFCIKRQFTKVVGDGWGTTVLFNKARAANSFSLATCTVNSGSPIVTGTGLGTSGPLTVGMWVNVTTGTYPYTNKFGSTVKSLDSANQITLDTNATFSNAGGTTVGATFALITVVTDRAFTLGNGFVEVAGLGAQNVGLVQFEGTAVNFDGATQSFINASLRNCYLCGYLFGARFSQCYQPFVSGNIFDQGVVGLLLYASRYGIISDNLTFQTGNEGMQIVWDGVIRQMGNVVTGNIIQQSGYDGLLVAGQDEAVVTSNVIEGAGKSAANTYSAIELQTTTHSIVSGNATTDELAAANTKYGVNADAASTNNVIGPNDTKIGINVGGKILNIVGANNTVIEQGIRTEPNQYAARSFATAGTSYTDSATVATALDTNAINRGAMWATGANTKLTVPTASSTVVSGAGTYQITGSISWPNTVVGIRQAMIRKNGTTILARTLYNFPTASTAGPITQVTYTDHSAVDGDYYELCGYQDSGGALVGVVADASYTFFEATKVN